MASQQFSNSCGSCGISIPTGQQHCSMCYGDPYYGKDGYYLAELEREDQEREREEQEQERESNER